MYSMEALQTVPIWSAEVSDMLPLRTIVRESYSAYTGIFTD